MTFGRNPIGTVAVMAGIPALPTEFAWAMMQTIQYCNEYLCQPNEYVHLEKASVSYHPQARNELCYKFLGEWILMLDTDQTFEPDLVARMAAVFNQHNLDILTGLYHYKNPPYLPVLYSWNEAQGVYNVVGTWDQKADLVEVDCAGAGCLMIRRKVITEIVKQMKCGPFDVIHPWSEDFSFFIRAKKLGFRVFCDPRIETYHMAVKTISSRDKDLSSVPMGVQ